MSVLAVVRNLVGEVLQIGDRASALMPDAELLGTIPEFDSMAVVSVLTAIEEHFGIFIEDDEITAETFLSLGALTSYVELKLRDQ